MRYIKIPKGCVTFVNYILIAKLRWKDYMATVLTAISELISSATNY